MPRCVLCDGVGLVTEFRLTWLQRQGDGSFKQCTRRVESFEDGAERIQELVANVDVSPQLMSGARKCKCRAVRVKAAPPVGAVIVPAVERDWKMAQAGERS